MLIPSPHLAYVLTCTIFSVYNASFYQVQGEKWPKAGCMLKLHRKLHRIKAVSAVSDRQSKGCSRDEASDHCKITVLVITGLQKKKKRE